MITSNISKLALRRGHSGSRVCLRRTCEIICSMHFWERSVWALCIGSYLITSKLIWILHPQSRINPIHIIQIWKLLFSIIICHSSIDIALIFISNWHRRLQDTKRVLDTSNIVESNELLLVLLPLGNWAGHSFFWSYHLCSTASCSWDPKSTLWWFWNSYFCLLLVVLFVYLFNLVWVCVGIWFLYPRSRDSWLWTEFSRFYFGQCINLNCAWSFCSSLERWKLFWFFSIQILFNFS